MNKLFDPKNIHLSIDELTPLIREEMERMRIELGLPKDALRTELDAKMALAKNQTVKW